MSSNINYPQIFYVLLLFTVFELTLQSKIRKKMYWKLKCNRIEFYIIVCDLFRYISS